MRLQHLLRTWYATDVDAADLEYAGAFSASFPDNGWQLVAVDWSQRGVVEVTWLVPGGRPADVG